MLGDTTARLLSAHRTGLWLAAVCITLSGCSTGFNIKDLAKSEVDIITEAHQEQANILLNRLMGKLYRRNPRELAKTPGATIDSRKHELANFLAAQRQLPKEELKTAELQARKNMTTALAADYTGDRVMLLMKGLSGMLALAYNNQLEFYLFDQLDGQKLYHSARNIEILMWQLRRSNDATGMPLLLTNSLPNESTNLSFERLFGKLIQTQEMMAIIVSGRTQRTIVYVTQNIASMAFLPL